MLLLLLKFKPDCLDLVVLVPLPHLFENRPCLPLLENLPFWNLLIVSGWAHVCSAKVLKTWKPAGGHVSRASLP